MVLVLLIVQRSADGFVCEKDVDHCHTSLILDNAFTMIDPNIGPVFVDNGILFTQYCRLTKTFQVKTLLQQMAGTPHYHC